MLLLGIETSCDDTSAAIVKDGSRVLSNVATNQDEFHAKYGGIVPEIASRQHVALLSAAVEDAAARANVALDEINGIAVTRGPGLIGSLVIGVASAKALAFALRKPLYGVNHLHGHIFAAFLDRNGDVPAYPFLTLLVSGGHSQLVTVEGPSQMHVIGRTKDDAAGEAFDKTARILGLPFPGGPEIDRLARDGNPKAVAFPRHRGEPGSLDMSFSGIKTAVKYFVQSDGGGVSKADIAASFQAAVVDMLMQRVAMAFERRAYTCVVLSGGVAANSALQHALREWGKQMNVPIFIPPPKYCTDNAAMIAAAAAHQKDSVRVDALTLSADPNLPFELSSRGIEGPRGIEGRQ